MINAQPQSPSSAIQLTTTSRSPQDGRQIATPASNAASSSTSIVDQGVFFGESNTLTFVSRKDRDTTTSCAPALIRSNDARISSSQEAESTGTRRGPVKNKPQSTAKLQYLSQEGCFTFPNPTNYASVLKAYFLWFHPCFPIVDRSEFARLYDIGEIPPLLLHTLIFIGASYCDIEAINQLGFSDRVEAKAAHFHRAKLLFEADWETNHVTILQSLFLLSFWRGSWSTVKNLRYWLGAAISLAQAYGFHRSTAYSTTASNQAKLRRRIWWSIYVRDRQSSASLGLPSRIRDEDCDVEMLEISDLEEEIDASHTWLVGNNTSEHVVYATKMVSLARILGQIIDDLFAPSRRLDSGGRRQQLDLELSEWKASLPTSMQTYSPEEGTCSVWTCLLHLGFNHLLILLHRGEFVRSGPNQDSPYGQTALKAARHITNIVEDMLSQNTIQFGQMHSITSIFAALCIHTIDLKRSEAVAKRLAEVRAKICLLGLKEIQKFWELNNAILSIFFRYLEENLAKRLRDGEMESEQHSANITRNTSPAAQGMEALSNAAYGSNTNGIPDYSSLPTDFELDSNRDQLMQQSLNIFEQDGNPDDFSNFLNTETFLNYGIRISDFDFFEKRL